MKYKHPTPTKLFKSQIKKPTTCFACKNQGHQKNHKICEKYDEYLKNKSSATKTTTKTKTTPSTSRCTTPLLVNNSLNSDQTLTSKSSYRSNLSAGEKKFHGINTTNLTIQMGSQNSMGEKFALSFSTNGVSASLTCKKEIIMNGDNTTMELPQFNDKVSFVGSDPGARCRMAGIKVQSLVDIGNKDKEQRFCKKNSTYRYRSGEFERAKKRVYIAGDVDNQVQN
ncbi:hypothetical protein HCN44_007888 [Aphidius gifuensis]|uniref:Uncharacterized protein n=1 Tax=Aphidius gifuensis TaxID=684658 RepID=A0A834XWC2_APHGI|nr:hypothetical protein HCN44_007888 [Aphidius gifuensis]